jgi:hypothetical protein
VDKAECRQANNRVRLFNGSCKSVLEALDRRTLYNEDCHIEPTARDAPYFSISAFHSFLLTEYRIIVNVMQRGCPLPPPRETCCFQETSQTAVERRYSGCSEYRDQKARRALSLSSGVLPFL